MPVLRRDLREIRSAIDIDAGSKHVTSNGRAELVLSPDLSVVVLEKGSEVGAHILSGAVIDPVGLDTLLPEWRQGLAEYFAVTASAVHAA